MVMSILYTLAALLSLASATPFAPRAEVAAAAANGSSSDQTYIELLYPRNETYKLEKPLPIVLAAYNLPATEALGNFSLQWLITGYSEDGTPGGLQYGSGRFWPRNQTAPTDKSKPLVMADFVDLLVELTQRSSYDFRGYLELRVYADYDLDLEADACVRPEPKSPGDDMLLRVRFRVEMGWEGKYRNTDAVAIDLGTATGCPGAGAGVRVTTTSGQAQPQGVTTAHAAATCTQTVVTPMPTEKSGCPYTVDASMASSISSCVSVLTIPPPTATLPTYSPNRAAAGMPIQTGGGLAAVVGAAMMLL